MDQPFYFWGGRRKVGGEGWVIQVVGMIFFQAINFTMNFFLKYAFAQYFFSPSNTLRDFFCAWMGLKK